MRHQGRPSSGIPLQPPPPKSNFTNWQFIFHSQPAKIPSLSTALFSLLSLRRTQPSSPTYKRPKAPYKHHRPRSEPPSMPKPALSSEPQFTATGGKSPPGSPPATPLFCPPVGRIEGPPHSRESAPNSRSKTTHRASSRVRLGTPRFATRLLRGRPAPQTPTRLFKAPRRPGPPLPSPPGAHLPSPPPQW